MTGRSCRQPNQLPVVMEDGVGVRDCCGRVDRDVVGVYRQPGNALGEAGVRASRPIAPASCRRRGSSPTTTSSTTSASQPQAQRVGVIVDDSISRYSLDLGEVGVGHADLLALVHVRGAAVQVQHGPSVLAEFTRCSELSSPNRETARGWSWLFQYSLFQPTSARPACQRSGCFQIGQPAGLPGPTWRRAAGRG